MFSGSLLIYQRVNILKYWFHPKTSSGGRGFFEAHHSEQPKSSLGSRLGCAATDQETSVKLPTAVSRGKPNVNPTIQLSCGDEIYQPFMDILGMAYYIYYWLYHILLLSQCTVKKNMHNESPTTLPYLVSPSLLTPQPNPNPYPTSQPSSRKPQGLNPHEML